tara:strand:- start:3749 stop:4153 length:405 start_codon:yes stop_codon:yes gene_type:complete
MAKEDKKPASAWTVFKNTTISISAVLIAIVSIYSIGNTGYRHFAKTEEVEAVQAEAELIDSRLELKIIDDEIIREKNTIHELESYKIFQQVEEPEFSEPEKKIIEEKKERIKELKDVRKKKFSEIQEKVKVKDK